MKASRKLIIALPHPSLRKASKPVASINPQIKNLIADMESAALDWEDHREHEVGVALAAVQINKLMRVVVIRNSFEDKKDRTFSIFINPKIVKASSKKVEDFEGCLSVQDVYGKVPRAHKITVKALDIEGKAVTMDVEGFLARVFQHEIDHTNGKLFIDHIKDRPDAFHKLNADGKLESLDYEKDIRNNPILW